MSETLEIDALFPSHLKTYCCRITDHTDVLQPEELKLISKAIDKRRYEFSTGRFCIKKTLELLKIPVSTVLQKKNGEPAWPENITASISHSFNWAGAAAAKTDKIYAVGFDIETIARISQNILKRITTPKEDKLFLEKSGKDALIYAALIFSAKEAIYKALSPIYSETLRFKDVSVIYKDDSPEFEIKLSRKLKSFLKEAPSPFCRFMIHDNDIFTAITFPKSS